MASTELDNARLDEGPIRVSLNMTNGHRVSALQLLDKPSSRSRVCVDSATSGNQLANKSNTHLHRHNTLLPPPAGEYAA
jgi:hypothetical protein